MCHTPLTTSRINITGESPSNDPIARLKELKEECWKLRNSDLPPEKLAPLAMYSLGFAVGMCDTLVSMLKSKETKMVTETEINQAIEAKGSTVPKVTPEHIESLIIGEYITTLDKAFRGCPPLPEMQIYTVCYLVLQSGFIVEGHSSPVSPESFDEALGRKIARERAIQKIYELEGYRLKCELSHTRCEKSQTLKLGDISDDELRKAHSCEVIPQKLEGIEKVKALMD